MRYYKQERLNRTLDIIALEGQLDFPWIEISEEEYNIIYNELERQDEINELKKSLSDSDYKIIQCMEQFLVDNSLYTTNLPYDINELHAERQTARDRINEIE